MTSVFRRRAGALLTAAALGLGTLLALAPAHAQRVSDIRGTKHNFATNNSGSNYTYTYYGVDADGNRYTGTNTLTGRRILASTETQVCVFCHTPHAATVQSSEGWSLPLWNRQVANATYQTYKSTSLDALKLGNMTELDQPSGSSKLCLSCHDGTLAVNTVNVLNGQTGVPANTISFTISGTALSANTAYKLGDDAAAGGQYTGNTRVIGIDLTNDHPISLTYNASLAARDGELRTLSASQAYSTAAGTLIISRKVVGQPKGKLPLEMTGIGYRTISGAGSASSGTDGQIQCATCHDPHIRELSGPDKGYEKFLRLNRFQAGHPSTSAAAYTTPADFSPSGDLICLACHDKNLGSAQTYLYSAHADPRVADETYLATSGSKTPAADRDFPAGLAAWRASCLNCHDPHTVAGSRRLLREGIVGAGSGQYPKTQLSQAYATDRKPAIEETCYQCHNDFTGGGTGGASGYRAIGFAMSSGFAQVPQIRYEFVTRPNVSNARMPLTQVQVSGATPTGQDVEIHDIGFGSATDCELGTYNLASYSNAQTRCGADFVETQAKLQSRHAECTDCHNPHRVLRTRCFNGVKNASACTGGTSNEYQTPDVWPACVASGNCTTAQQQDPGTHNHLDSSTMSGNATAGSMKHTNVISGVLRGAYGVQPIYTTLSGNSFYNPSANIQFRILRGDPPTNWNFSAAQVPFNGDTSEVTDNAAANQNIYVTREYQICLKCHSTFGAQKKGPLFTQLEPLGIATASGTNGLTYYTDQAREFRAPKSHSGESVNKGIDGGAKYDANNHRGWHPVMGPTGRTGTIRGNGTDISSNWKYPWRNDVGNQTMYCSDCHGSDLSMPGNGSYASVIPNGGTSGNPRIWGPHGSANPFILKAPWAPNGGTSPTGRGRPDDLCFRCHDYATYATDSGIRTGFYDASRGKSDLHSYHNNRIAVGLRCTWCHVAVPHGWKNKALLVNLNDVGPEASGGTTPGSEVCTGGSGWGTGNPLGGTCGAGGGTKRGYDNPPYYMGATLKITAFNKSGQWNWSNCGSASSGTNQINWMQAACDK